MPCLVVLLSLAFPRVAIVLLFLFTAFFERAFQSLIVLGLGFLFLPLTTIVYAWTVNGNHPLAGVYLVALVVAALVDLGIIGQSARRKKAQ